MSRLIDLKNRAHQECLHWVQQKQSDLEQLLLQMDESARGDTKSSMGDKYETAQAMLHLEKEKYQSQLVQIQSLHKVLFQINPLSVSEVIDLGSFLDTDQGYFYLAIPAGVLSMGEIEFTAISPTSPLGVEFKKAALDQRFSFRGRSYHLRGYC